ncbi:hypothetical protein KQX54_011717 [Cotesia glomerata]|uniref:Uncharacterized protein n=1 Tax=Cotesia glomerata TaxID=32391 RepID=A0AAV7J152_COTGL|nr:hypothetical protein KQX54_011717 [Cotesia glomerata]
MSGRLIIMTLHRLYGLVGLQGHLVHTDACLPAACSHYEIYTRSARGIRGFIEAYVAAFDKHWNLALEDCYETWTRKVKRKAPILDAQKILTKIFGNKIEPKIFSRNENTFCCPSNALTYRPALEGGWEVIDINLGLIKANDLEACQRLSGEVENGSIVVHVSDMEPLYY